MRERAALWEFPMKEARTDLSRYCSESVVKFPKQTFSVSFKVCDNANKY